MKKVLFLLAMSLLVVSCGNKTEAIKKLSDEVLRVHDEVMPKMQDIVNLKKDLQAIADSTLDADVATSIHAEIEKLTTADENMMQWMRDYNGPAADATDEQKIAYYNTELEKINTVKTETESAIESAKKELEKYAK